MAASGYTGNPPGSGGGGGTGAVDSVNGKTGVVVLAPIDIQLGNVNNTSDLAKPVSAAVSSALATKADLASPTFTGTVGGLSKTMVQLGNVDNTSDASKPVSTAQAAALALKANLASPTFTGTVAGISATMVGLGNVTNTSDANKPVSTAQATAIGLKADLASPTFTGTPAAPTATPGTNTTQLASTAFVTAAVLAGGGGGGAAAPTFARVYVTTGDITPPADAGWAVLSGLSLSIPAVAGEDIELNISAMLHSGGGADNFYDAVVLNGTTIIRAASTGTATPAVEGDPSIYPSTAVGFRGSTILFSFVAQAGDIFGGNVTFGLAHKGPGGGTAKVYASTNYPFRWVARNDH